MEYNYLPAELPIRAWEAFKDYKKGEYEVSLLLSITWAVFVVPTERLDFLKQSMGLNLHHTGDSKILTGIPKQLIKLWEEKKRESIPDLEQPEGIYTFVDREALKPAGTNEWRSQIIIPQHLNVEPIYSDLVTVLRHGLSHGNIWTDENKAHIENLYIANYPPSKSNPVNVLRIQVCTLYSLVEKFVAWYKECIKSNGAKGQISSQHIESELIDPSAERKGL